MDMERRPTGDNGNILAVLEFSPQIQPETRDWLGALIKAPVSAGGAGLDYRVDPNVVKKCDNLHIFASMRRLLEGAEKLKIKKPHKGGTLMEFSLQHCQGFVNFSMDGTGFLLESECHRIVLDALNNIRAHEDGTVPGFPDVKIHKNRTIVPLLLAKGIITQVYPLHNFVQMKALEHKWYRGITRKQPLDAVREYFGETIAMYFGFLGFYSLCLVPPVILVMVFSLSAAHEQTKNTVFAVLSLIWATVFLEAWKRRSAEMAFNWGTLQQGIGNDESEEPRPTYYGDKRISPVTGLEEQHYPSWKRQLKTYGISYPIVGLCMWGATLVMLVYFQLHFYLEGKYGKSGGVVSTVMMLIPTVFYAVMIAVMNNLYYRLAVFLNEWENHRLESAYQNHLIVKLVLFYFVNCFYSLFYVAFYLQDIELLRTNLAALLITSQMIQQVTESLIPYVMYKLRVTTVSKEGKKFKVETADLSDDTERQGQLEPYPGTFNDYLEMFLQFGYVILFSSAYPMATFWALLNNVIEMRTDAFKLCRMHQRPFAIPTATIGAWQFVFEGMGVIAVITNCALIGIAAKSADWLPEMTPINAVLLFVAFEHVILAVKFIIAFVIPDVPQWVQCEMAKQDFQAQQALKSHTIKKETSI